MSGVQKSRKLIALTLILPLVLVGLTLGRSSTAAAADRDIYIIGHGKAHGVGMCMTGAYNQIQAGRTPRQVIDYYYTGLDPNFGSAGGDIRVGVYASAAPSTPITITCAAQFKVMINSAWQGPYNPGNAAIWREGSNYRIIVWENGASSSSLDTWSNDPVWVDSYDIANPTPLGVYEMGYSFRGMMLIYYGPTSGQLWVINQVNIEYYLWGQQEEPSSSPPEFLNLTAILMRTYAWYHKLYGGKSVDGVFDLTANADSQVYRGVEAEFQKMRDAQAATSGQIATHGGEAIITAYHSCCGGATESYKWVWGNGTQDIAYLQGVTCGWCTSSSNYNWQITWKLSDIQATLNANGTYTGNIDQIYVSQHSPSGRAFRVTINGSAGEKVISGEAFKSAVDPSEVTVKSTLYDIFDSAMSTECGTFAEGYTGAGFDEYLTLLNPDPDNAAHIMVDYMFSDGTDTIKSYTVPAHTRSTIYVNGEVGAGREVSMRVLGDRQVFAERPMYFNYGGWCTGGSDVTGSAVPAQSWYFAEGYTGPGFDEYLTVANPQGSATHIDIAYMFNGASSQGQAFDMAPHSRATIRVNDVVGPDREVSMLVVASQPVTAERPMYFNYGGWTGGHTVAGLAGQAATQFYFAEGYTGPGFDEYLTLANPQGQAATVNIRYLFNGASPQQQTLVLQPSSRFTIKVNDVVGAGRDVSVIVTSDQAIVAERPLYFNYGGWCTDGSVAVGATASATTLSFAEGCTRPGFQEYLCIANPNAADAQVTLTYTYEDGGTAPVPYTVPANSRITVDVNRDAGPGRDISIILTSTQPVIAERPMYFSYGSWTGGHDAFGVAP